MESQAVPGTRMILGGYAAIGAGAVTMLGLHVVTGLDPVHTVISEYAFEADGWLLPVSLTLFAVAATVVAVLLARRGEDRRAALLVGLWGLCMLLIGAFPTDEPGVPLSMSGGIHRYAAFVAFLTMPIAACFWPGGTRPVPAPGGCGCSAWPPWASWSRSSSPTSCGCSAST
ncbi:DUF998 domain-containing protein [Streptosporangium lutulentum]